MYRAYFLVATSRVGPHKGRGRFISVVVLVIWVCTLLTTLPRYHGASDLTLYPNEPPVLNLELFFSPPFPVPRLSKN